MVLVFPPKTVLLPEVEVLPVPELPPMLELLPPPEPLPAPELLPPTAAFEPFPPNPAPSLPLLELQPTPNPRSTIMHRVDACATIDRSIASILGLIRVLAATYRYG